MSAATALRPSSKVKSELALTVKHQPGNSPAIAELRQEYKASLAAEYLHKVIGSFPPLTQEQISELQGILAAAGGSTGHKKPVDEYRGHGRTQWDAMTEAISKDRFRATRLALLMSVRYGPPNAALVTLAYKLIEMLGHHH